MADAKTDDNLRRQAEDSLPVGEAAAPPTIGGLLDGLAASVTHGQALGKAGASLGAELVKVALGRSEVAPARGDWRFKDPTWTDNPVYRRVAQSYLATCAAADSVVDAVEESGDHQRAERARFVFNVLTSTMAPTNTLLGNPGALKRTFESGGRNLVRGGENFVGDLRHNGGMPSMVKPGVLKIGVDMALTPGSVVQVDEVGEVLQYKPTTDQVHTRPVLVIPPPIGRYYFLDLRPGRSFVEYAVGRGIQTFLLSWRNPSPAESEWGLDTYAQRILDAIDAVREVTGSPDVNLIGFCAGGILQTLVLNKLAAAGDTRVHSASYAVTLLDWSGQAPIHAFSNAKLLNMARWNSRRSGVISARSMGSAFTWMRPNDLVWNYWVNNYLMGEDPPVFDILAWNADGTNLPARLHSEFLDIFETNSLAEPNALTALDTPVDLGAIEVPVYVTGAVNDHLTPWKGTYRTAQLMGGDATFALSNAGHIAALVNPPDNPKATYYTGPQDKSLPAQEWLESAEKQTGSWWTHWADWVIEHGGETKAAPRRLGSRKNPPTAEAPGNYVRQAN